MPDSAAEEALAKDDELPLPDRTRLRVARDIVVFQAKLLADGFRDLLLSPVSIILGLIGLLISKQPGEPFYRLLRIGRSTEVWIDLFGDAYPDNPDAARRREGGLRDLEHHVRALEKNLTSEDYDQGARESLARVRESLKKLRKKRIEDKGDTHDTADGTRQDH